MNYRKTCNVCRELKDSNDFSLMKNDRINRKDTCRSCFTKEYGKIFRDKRYFGGNRIKALIRDNHTCTQCGMTNEQHLNKYKREITVDHIDGRNRYSSNPNNELSNLRTLCLSCHGFKDQRHMRMLAAIGKPLPQRVGKKGKRLNR